MSNRMLPSAPPLAPKLNSRFWPWLARVLLRLSGWRLLGEPANEPKLILIGAPHSSYWDGYFGLLMKIGLGVDISVMIKREVLDGPLGILLRPIGMIAINRSAALNVVDQMVQRFAEREKMWLGITPEGTRKKVTHWKSGFLRIAHDASVPIQTLFIDYPSKTFTFGPVVRTTEDHNADMAKIRELFTPYQGKHRNANG